MTREMAFTGLESAIILIALVVVASVFATAILGAGFFSSEKAKDVTTSGYKTASSVMYIEGGVYATIGSSNQLDTVMFSAGIPETGQPQDLSKMIIVYTHSASSDQLTYEYGGSTPTHLKFGVNGDVIMLPGDKRIFTLTEVNGPIPGGWFSIELKPLMGASSFVKYYLSDTFRGGSILTQ